MNPEILAKAFHESYERLAPGYGYNTRKASAVPWEDVPTNNKNLMISTCEDVIDKFGLVPTKDPHREVK